MINPTRSERSRFILGDILIFPVSFRTHSITQSPRLFVIVFLFYMIHFYSLKYKTVGFSFQYNWKENRLAWKGILRFTYKKLFKCTIIIAHVQGKHIKQTWLVTKTMSEWILLMFKHKFLHTCDHVISHVWMINRKNSLCENETHCVICQEIKDYRSKILRL